MAEMLKLQTYNMHYSLYRKGQFNVPTVYPLGKLQLPKSSIYHFVAVDGVTMGPQMSDPLMRAIPGIIYLDHVIKYHDPIGSPQKKFSNPAGMITDFRKRNRAFRPLKNIERLETDTRSLVVFNYSMLAHIVKYAATFRAGYYMWHNVYQEVVNNINALGKESHRQQFIEIDLPDVMPSLTSLRQFGARQSNDTFKHIRTPEAMTVADLFQWAGVNRESSVLGGINPKYFDKVNLLVRRLNGWVVINLGWMESFRKDSHDAIAEYEKAKLAAKEAVKAGETPEEVPVVNTHGFEIPFFQLKVLKLLTMLHQATSPIDTPTQAEVVGEPTAEIDEEAEKSDTLDMDIEDTDYTADEEHMVDDKETEADLEKELDELDKLKLEASHVELFDEDGNAVENTLVQVDILSQIAPAAPDGTAMIRKADELSTKGLVNAAEYRRLVRLAEAHKTILDPYGSDELMIDAVKIPEHDVLIAPPALTTDAMVVDKSMTYSRVDAADKQYINKVLKKDIMRCVMAMQKSPVSITAYTVERITTAVDDNEIHTIKVTPAVGIPSVLKFPIPVIKPDGTFLYKGTNYRMRKQRSD